MTVVPSGRQTTAETKGNAGLVPGGVVGTLLHRHSAAWSSLQQCLEVLKDLGGDSTGEQSEYPLKTDSLINFLLINRICVELCMDAGRCLTASLMTT